EEIVQLEYRQREWLAVLLAVILAIPLLRAQKISLKVLQPQPEVPEVGSAQLETGDVESAPLATPEPECTFFKNFPQYSALGPDGLQRVSASTADAEAIRHMSEVSAQTDQVAQALAPTSSIQRPASFTGPWMSRVDYYIFTALQQKNITPAPLTTDEEFLRRVTIDLIGRTPTGDQVQQFNADTDPQKRS